MALATRRYGERRRRFGCVPSVSPASPAFLPSAEVPNTAGLDRLHARARTPPRGLARSAATTSCWRSGSATARALRDAVAGARRDQQGRVELRPQHGPELGRRDRLDAVHAVDLGALGRRRRRRRASRTRGTPRTRSPRPRATSPPPAARPTSRARSSPTTTPSGTSTRCCSSPSSSAAAGVDATFKLDRLQVSLDRAARTVVRGEPEAARGAERDLRALSAAARPRCAAARRQRSLLSDQLALDQPRRPARRRGSRDARLASARPAGASSRQARQRSRPGARPLARGLVRPGRRLAAGRAGLRRPATSSRSVAAPRVVSVSHHHHDYPAADIAAPEGSPVYALADATVVRVVRHPRGPLRHRPDDRRPRDGQEWTYCHLSYLDPTVIAGVHARRRHRGRPRREDRPRDRPAPPPPARPDDARTRSCSRGSRASRAPPSAGRTPGRPTRSVAAATRRVFAVVPTRTEESDAQVVLFTR